MEDSHWSASFKDHSQGVIPENQIWLRVSVHALQYPLMQYIKPIEPSDSIDSIRLLWDILSKPLYIHSLRRITIWLVTVQSYKSAEKMDLGTVPKLQLLYCPCRHMIKIQALSSLPLLTIAGVLHPTSLSLALCLVTDCWECHSKSLWFCDILLYNRITLWKKLHSQLWLQVENYLYIVSC